MLSPNRVRSARAIPDAGCVYRSYSSPSDLWIWRTRCGRTSALRRHECHGVVLEHRAGEFAAIARAGVDADTVRPYRRRGARGEGGHDDNAEVLLAGQEALSDAELVVLGLTGECHARPDA